MCGILLSCFLFPELADMAFCKFAAAGTFCVLVNWVSSWSLLLLNSCRNWWVRWHDWNSGQGNVMALGGFV